MNSVSVVSVLPEVGIKFSDGSHLFSHHEEECCEDHYADFNYVSLEDFEGMLFDVSSLDFIIPIEGYGFRMKSKLKGFILSPILYVILFLIYFGVVAPALISAPSTLAVVLGISGIVGMWFYFIQVLKYFKEKL